MVTSVDVEDVKYPQIRQIHKSSYTYKNYYNKPCIAQEKLDGCNFRIICRNGKVVFGSRTMILKDDSFCNFGSIKKPLLENVEELRNILGLDNFMIVGELIGYNKDKLIIPRIGYFEEKVVKFYAFEMFNINSNQYLDFVRAQQLLKTAGFNVIPFEESTISDLKFKSTLFPHVRFIEGYVLRFGEERFKIKSEEYLKIENGGKPESNKAKKPSVMDFIHGSAFFDFVSKGIVNDAQKFHEGLCKEIIEEYLINDSQDSCGNVHQRECVEKKEEIKGKANEIFSRTYGLIRSNKNSIENFDMIFSNYDMKRAKEEFTNYIFTI